MTDGSYCSPHSPFPRHIIYSTSVILYTTEEDNGLHNYYCETDTELILRLLPERNYNFHREYTPPFPRAISAEEIFKNVLEHSRRLCGRVAT